MTDEYRKIVFIGGDMRMAYAAEKLAKDYDCVLSGFDMIGTEKMHGVGNARTGDKYDAAVLPVFAGGSHEIRCPYSNRTYDINILTIHLRRGGMVFAGRVFPELEQFCADSGYQLCDYLEREELAVRNAELTAEGAVAIAINETGRALLGAHISVLGFGRIGKICARYFSSLGAAVTVCARRKSDLAWAESLGYRTTDIFSGDEFCGTLADTDIIVNTAPAEVITGERAAAIKKGALLIELASVPCTKGETPARIISAGGLPGKTAPISAGEIIADTIENILTERSMKNGGA